MHSKQQNYRTEQGVVKKDGDGAKAFDKGVGAVDEEVSLGIGTVDEVREQEFGVGPG